MNQTQNEFNKASNKNILLFKLILLLILIVLDVKLKKIEQEHLLRFFKSIPRLKYYYIDMKPYRDTLKFENDARLEIYTNNDTSNYIKTKSSGKILKSSIVFLVIPGGSYKIIGEVEALPICKKFFSLGYSSALLRYSVFPSHYPTQYNQGLLSIKKLSSKFKKIILIGFSAGGHLTGLLGTSGKDKLYNTIGMILCYPVISFVNNVHAFSRYNFFGGKNDTEEKEWEKFSVENRVNNETIPTFIWTIKNDNTVPYENTLAMIDSLKKYGIKHDYKIYKEGVHGMALADEFDIRNGNIGYKNELVARWINLAINFFEKILKDN